VVAGFIAAVIDETPRERLEKLELERRRPSNSKCYANT
jgi:hypothetical protein